MGINLETSAKVAGKFKITVTNPEGETKVLADWFDNMILDAGLNRLGTGDCLPYCSVGSGTTAPSAGQTQLSNYIGSVSASSYGSNAATSAPYYWARNVTYSFTQGAVTGALSEVGVGWAANTLFSRALILDVGNNPTTITVLSTDVLTISYELRLYPPVSDITGTVVLGGVTYNTIIRASNANSSSYATGIGNLITFLVTGQGSWVVYNGALGSVTSVPGGSTGTTSSCIQNAYVNNSLQQTAVLTINPADGNLTGGISAIVIPTYIGASYSFGAYQIGFTPPIPKDNTKTLVLNFTLSWARGSH